MERDKDNIENIIEQDKLLKSHKTNIKKVSQDIKSNYSSTYVREEIKEGKDEVI